MRILFVVAEMQEAMPIIEHYKMGSPDLEYINIWSDRKHEHQLIITGPGVNNVINSLSRAMYLGFLNPSVNIINVGYAGAKGLDVGDVVPVKACRCLEFPVLAKVGTENYLEITAAGVDCYTSFDFVKKAENISGMALFDMELAYISRFVYNSLFSVKIVSDNLDYASFKTFDNKNAWEKAFKIIEKYIKRKEEKEKCFKEHYHIKQ